MAVSGANFAVAESGTLVVVESEGNGRMCLTLPEVLVTVVGIEKLVPTWADLDVFLRLLPRSSTGERMNPYTSTWSGVTPGDGPQEVHVVLLDNGRTRALADEVGRQALRCIRCSACLNSCPVYERVGGHAYGSVYPGPIGAILNPLLKGVGTDPQVDSLPYASTLCGACADVCPVAIDIPGILVHLRTKVVDAHRGDTVPKAEAVAMRAAAWGMADAGRMGLGERAAGLVGPVRPRPRDAGWSPRAVLAALARVALDPGPRPPAAAGRVVPLLVAPGRPRRGASDDRPRRRARRRPCRPRRRVVGRGWSATTRHPADVPAGAHRGADRRSGRDARPVRRTGCRLPRHRDPLRRSRSRRRRSPQPSTARHPSSCRPGWSSTFRARWSTTG